MRSELNEAPDAAIACRKVDVPGVGGLAVLCKNEAVSATVNVVPLGVEQYIPTKTTPLCREAAI